MRLFSVEGNKKRAFFILCVVAVLFVAASCTTTKNVKPKFYRLQSICEVPLGTKDEATAYVQLRKGGANVLTIFTTKKGYQVFRIYKQEQGQGDFKLQSTLNSVIPKDVLQGWGEGPGRAISFKDTGTTSVDDRYKIVPVADGSELPPVKTVYETDDLECFQRVEGKAPGK